MKLNARAAGERFYHSGQPCKQGHNSKRYASTGQCVECMTGKSDKPLTEAQQHAVQRYKLAFLLPLEATPELLLGLDTYMVDCAKRYMEHHKLLPASLINAQSMAQSTGKPIRDFL
jgi:hypothetical protein